MQNENEEIKKLPLQKIKTPKFTLGYNFNTMTFAQVMHAEERAILRSERIDYLEANPEAGFANDTLADIDYKLDMAAILFTPLENKKLAPFDKNMMDEIREEIAVSPHENYDILEGAILDFFTRRGKRMLALKTLDKNEKTKTALKLYQMLAMKGFSASQDSETKTNLIDESASEKPLT